MDNKKVLIITYYWPPSGGPGVQRWLKFVKYLPEFDITPIVLTVNPESAEYPVIDQSLELEIDPELKVYRTDCRGVYDWYKKIARTTTAPYSGFANESDPGLIQKVARFIRGNFFLPDARRGWIKYAFKEAKQIIEQYGIDTIVTTGPPHSTHLTGLKLKRKYNVKWIADFRDPWTSIYYNDFLYQTKWAKSIDLSYERKVVMACDTILVAADRRTEFVKSHPEINPEKIIFFPNGYDENDFKDEKPVNPSSFTIRYIGTMAASYPIGGWIKAMAGLPGDFLVQFIGKTDTNIQTTCKQELGDKIAFIDFVPHKQSIQYMLSSSVLLLVIPQTADNKYILPGKLFEYLATGKQILVLGPTDGTAAQIVRNAKAGDAFDFNDTEGIKNFMLQQYQYHIHQSYPVPDFIHIKQFCRKELTKQLAKMI